MAVSAAAGVVMISMGFRDEEQALTTPGFDSLQLRDRHKSRFGYQFEVFDFADLVGAHGFHPDVHETGSWEMETAGVQAIDLYAG